jgi:aldehyde:ferredoxin oxidoreductase
MKIIRVNMTETRVTTESLPEEYNGWGGRGLTSRMINREVPPICDPLGPENRLIIAPGTLSGTRLVNTSRVSIGAKSPLTGGIKESNAGGTTGAVLGRLGIACIVIEGQPGDRGLYILRIDRDGKPALMPADEYKGLTTYALTESLLQAYGAKNSILCIGPAGEFRLSSASIQATDLDGRPCRAAGRGGLGAVLGAKGIKAVAIEQGGPDKNPIADPPAFEAAARDFAKIIKNNPFTGQMLPALGTAGLVGPVNLMGAFPNMNATQGTMDDWEKISGEALAETIEKRGGKTTHKGCSHCFVRCSNEFVDKQSRYVTSSLEYETIWAMGGMTGIRDLDIIARLDYLCDNIGVDTMNTGVAIAVAMDAGHISFGNGQAAIDLVEQIGQGSELGKILGNGPDAMGKYLGHQRVATVKGQSIAAYDPRAMQGNAVTYATSPMGADHTAGNLIGAYLGGVLDPLQPDGQIDASRNAQINMILLDCTGMCLLAGAVLNVPEGRAAFLRAMNAKSGTEFNDDDILAMSTGVLKAELDFNRKAGLTHKDDRLPEFFYTEPLPPHNKVVLISGKEMDTIFTSITAENR